MKITVTVGLQAPSNCMQIPGPNPVLFTKTFAIDLTPEILAAALDFEGMRLFLVETWKGKPRLCPIIGYDARENILHVSGGMASGTQAYMDHLTDDGWIKKEGAFEQYRGSLPVSETDQADWEESCCH